METTTNQISGIWRRIFAYIIDNFIAGLLLIIFIDLNSLQSNFYYYSYVAPITFFYYFFFEVIFDRTPGKLILRIIVIDASNEKYSESRMIKLIFIRTLCRFIPFDLISFLFSEDGQLWHDTISGTKVVLRKTLRDTYFSSL